MAFESKRPLLRISVRPEHVLLRRLPGDPGLVRRSTDTPRLPKDGEHGHPRGRRIGIDAQPREERRRVGRYLGWPTFKSLTKTLRNSTLKDVILTFLQWWKWCDTLANCS